MPLQQLGQQIFVDGNTPGTQLGYPILIHIHRDDFVSQLRETGRRDKTDVTSTNDRDFHNAPLCFFGDKIAWLSQRYPGTAVTVPGVSSPRRCGASYLPKCFAISRKASCSCL